jgi:hypothetical protein
MLQKTSSGVAALHVSRVASHTNDWHWMLSVHAELFAS